MLPPKELIKPKPPRQIVLEIRERKTIYKGDAITLEDLIAKVPVGVSTASIYLEVEQNWSYDQYDNNYAEISASYYVDRPNPKIKSEEKRFAKEQKAYEHALKLYERDYKQYIQDKADYDKWTEYRNILNLKKRLRELKKKKW